MSGKRVAWLNSPMNRVKRTTFHLAEMDSKWIDKVEKNIFNNIDFCI